MKVMRLSDRIKLKAKTDQGQVDVYIKPLRMMHRQEIAGHVKIVKGEEIPDFNAQTLLTIKYCVDQIDGLTDMRGEPITLEKDDSGFLTEYCAEEVLYFLKDAELLSNTLYSASREVSLIEGVEFDIVPN